MSINKRYLKTKPICRVSFRVTGVEAEKIQILGDFNQWEDNTPAMKKLKSGDFTQTIELKPGRAYRFRYLLDGTRWDNDQDADDVEKNCYGSLDSIIQL